MIVTSDPETGRLAMRDSLAMLDFDGKRNFHRI
jgi:hypothetical protein